LYFIGSYIKEPKHDMNYYVSIGTNKSEWKGIENLRFTQHTPPKDVLLKQVLIQKHDDLIKDIHILYHEMGLIQKKNETCKPHPDTTFGEDWCYGIGTMLIHGIIIKSDHFREGRATWFMEECDWPKFDKTKKCQTLFGCYLPKWEYTPNEFSAEICPITTQWFSDKWGHFMHYASTFNYVYNGPIIKENKDFMITNNDCMVVHIRRGDACYDKFRNCHSYDEYLQGMLIMKKLYNVNRAVLISDAHDLDIGIKLFNDNGFNVEYNKNINRTLFNVNEYPEFHKQDFGDAPIKEYMDDINSGYVCKILVGSFSSAMTKILFTMMVFHNQYYVPFYSVGGTADTSIFPDPTEGHHIITSDTQNILKIHFPK